MTNSKKSFKLPKYLGPVLIIVFVGLSFFIVLNDNFNMKIQQFFKPNYRKVLSTVTADLLNNGSSIKVVKIKTKDSLSLEVYGHSDTGVRPLISKILLPDKNDGYFHLQGQATNLALKDVDGDEIMEILAPTFDENMVAHLNVYKYNPDIKDFEPASP